ncbi:SpoIID/LytB domain-containing protein [bacterium]|nr:SpoIID/LytB domain-containing protein [bacterium]
MSRDERVRIGLAICRPSVVTRLTGGFELRAADGTRQQVESGEYTVTCEVAAGEPRFGQRLQTFSTRTAAEELLAEYAANGLSCELVQLGRPANWGEVGELSTESWSVVTGKASDSETAVLQARAFFETLLADEAKPAGWKRFADQLLWPDPIRLERPVGGVLRLTDATGKSFEAASPVQCIPRQLSSRFELAEIRIGIDFHWDHTETLPFRGQLDLVADGEGVTAVNDLELDEYLASVLGSEMRSDWPVEALAAQAVAARSTVLATRGRHHYGEAFDLCHDDHCQCYQGASRESETSRAALEKVRGQLLVKDGRVADARYAKSCGGIADHYHVAWDEEDISYMQPVFCGPLDGEQQPTISLMKKDPEKLIHELLDHPPGWAACNPAAEVYPPSCKEMEELYRWNRRIDPNQLQSLVERRTGRKLGTVKQLLPLERGVSGRIRYLRVVGVDGEVVVGKELAIRRLLSDSHLPSSAFRATFDEDGTLLLEGIGWGHGVGLCQLGAAALAARGWNAERLLMHYYPSASIVTR